MISEVITIYLFCDGNWFNHRLRYDLINSLKVTVVIFVEQF